MKMDIQIHANESIHAQFDGLTVITAQDGSAPAPFDLFLASMGTCGGFYLARFCKQRGIATEGIHITQEIQRDPDSHLVTHIDLAIHLPQSFPDKYRLAAVRAAEQCTVKKNLAAPPEIKVHLALSTTNA
jgi:ribosomal protein S12 methylthiotransferase accessory factor